MRKEQIITTNNNQMEEKGMMSRFIHFKKRFVPALSGALMGVMLMSTTCFAAGDTSAGIWVSLRSVDDFSVNEVAQKFFNGGGHFNASGGHLDCSLAEAEKITRQAIMYYADKLKL